MPIQRLAKLFINPYVSMTDEELMKAIQQSNYSAYTELYNRYKTPLYSYLYRLIPRHIADELLQEIFIKVLQKNDSFRFESKVKTWIWIITKNTVRDYWRSLDHKMTHSFDQLIDEDGNEHFASPLNSQEELFLNKVTVTQLETCINELPLDQKEIVLLHTQAELSHQEISDLTQSSIGAIKSVLFRAKEKLSECFKRGGHL